MRLKMGKVIPFDPTTKAIQCLINEINSRLEDFSINDDTNLCTYGDYTFVINDTDLQDISNEEYVAILVDAMNIIRTGHYQKAMELPRGGA